MEIKGTTKLLGVMGWPIAHTKSPAMQGAAIEAAGIDYTYVPLPVAPERVGEAVRGLRALGFRGCNVTIPHKLAVMEHLDELTSAAEGIGAVNTIIVEPDGRLIGHNTDADGAFEALEDATGMSALERDIVIIGAGGAARAAAWGAGSRRARRVTIVNRTVAKAEELVAYMKDQHPATHYRALASPSAQDLAETSMVLQMTSLGMKPGDALPLDPKLIPTGAVALEAVYAPRETAWLLECRAKGLHVVDGLAMLVAQGAKSFERWTGVKADMKVMKNALGS